MSRLYEGVCVKSEAEFREEEETALPSLHVNMPYGGLGEAISYYAANYDGRFVLTV